MTQEKVRLGSLCTGYGGLDMAVMATFDARLVWCADNDRHVTAFLDARCPDLPNLGDLTQLDWRTAESVDIIAAGFPCQDISYNGRGAGIEKGARSGIWKNIVTGICVLRPRLVVVENVAAIRRRGLDRVLGDLAELGYYTVWTSIRASEIGAPHRRERVFILGYQREAATLLATAYASRKRWPWRPRPGDPASGWSSGGPVGLGTVAVPSETYEGAASVSAKWGHYGEAIRRWTAVIGRPAPQPTERGVWGQTRLSPQFSEWLMGVPAGFVTDLELPYSAKHRILGNGVVPQQAEAALRMLVGTVVDGKSAML